VHADALTHRQLPYRDKLHVHFINKYLFPS
jgi:hypothetical protein